MSAQGQPAITESERAMAMLALLMGQGERLEAGDPGWVHRRVEVFRVLAENTVSRRVSVDFDLPDRVLHLGVDGTAVPAVPLTLMAKANLRNFDLRGRQTRRR